MLTWVFDQRDEAETGGQYVSPGVCLGPACADTIAVVPSGNQLPLYACFSIPMLHIDISIQLSAYTSSRYALPFCSSSRFQTVSSSSLRGSSWSSSSGSLSARRSYFGRASCVRLWLQKLRSDGGTDGYRSDHPVLANVTCDEEDAGAVGTRNEATPWVGRG